MKIGVIGSGSIGPDLAYGFATALAKGEGGTVHLVDIRQEALDAGLERIRGYVGKGVARGKLSPRVAAAIDKAVVPTTDMAALAGCEYVLEAATEKLELKQGILEKLEPVVGPQCLIGFATSGIPRRKIAAGARHPERCFVNHPFFPAWRALPVEVALSGDEALGARMLATLETLGKVPVVTADVECFAADDIFVNYCAEAARIVAEGTATPAQVDRIVDGAIGGGGPFNVMDLTRGNLLNVHCLELMRDAPTGGPWFEPPPILFHQGNTPWHDRKNPGDPGHDELLARRVLDRILAVLMARTFFVTDNGICAPRELNWLTKNALGFRAGLLDLAAEIGMKRIFEMCAAYAAHNPDFTVPKSIAQRRQPRFARNVAVEVADEIATVAVWRPEVLNALNERTMEELDAAFDALAKDGKVCGVILTGYGGSLAGADITELAALKTVEAAVQKCLTGHKVLARISALGKPVVAAVDGPTLGGGAELSMACHARVVGPQLMLGQPEVNLGIIPGYGGTQRLPRLIGLEKAAELLRTGRSVGAKEACALGWATGEPAADVRSAARDLVRAHLEGKTTLRPVDPAPLAVPERLPFVDLGHHSLAIDRILVGVLRHGLARPLAEGLKVEAEGFGECKRAVDYDIGMKNFIQNGPRVPAQFLNE
jgi:enoyl-CoA hydratase / 3-hydroxyacyl-CoA dehydrogenase